MKHDNLLHLAIVLAVACSVAAARQSTDDLSYVSLDEHIAVPINASVNRVTAFAFLPEPLAFNEAYIVTKEKARVHLLVFCTYRCKPSPGGYWAWVQVPFDDSPNLRIETVLDPNAGRTNVTVALAGNQIHLKLVLTTTDGWKSWRQKLSRAGLRSSLDPPTDLLLQDADLRVGR